MPYKLAFLNKTPNSLLAFMLKHIFRLLLVSFIASSTSAHSAHAQDVPHLAFPVDCTLGQDCWSVNYVDVAPSDIARDFKCQEKTYDEHKGTDFGLRSRAEMKAGVDVLAAAAGTVVRLRDGESDSLKNDEELETIKDAQKECGNGILIDHSAAGYEGLRTMYCHLKEGSLSVGLKDVVVAGQKIAQIGQSGLAEFPHLHFGVIWDGGVVDPFTGASAADGCGQMKTPLWQTPIPYEPLSIYHAGFRTNLPDFDAIKNGEPNPQTIDRNAPAFVFWAGYYGAREGDVITMNIKNPDGTVFVERTITQPKTRARQFYYTGRKISNGPLKSGTYRGEIQINRENLAPIVHRETLYVR